MLDETKKEKVYEYLNELRESGVTNMFGAAPFVQAAFELNIKDSREWLKNWMEDFEGE